MVNYVTRLYTLDQVVLACLAWHNNYFSPRGALLSKLSLKPSVIYGRDIRWRDSTQKLSTTQYSRSPTSDSSNTTGNRNTPTYDDLQCYQFGRTDSSLQINGILRSRETQYIELNGCYMCRSIPSPSSSRVESRLPSGQPKTAKRTGGPFLV